MSRRHELVQKMRQATEQAVRDGLLTLEESALLIGRYDDGLRGYTYLREKPEYNGLYPVAAEMPPAQKLLAPAEEAQQAPRGNAA